MTAWTTPRTWVTSETVTASLLNVHVRDNLNSLYEDSPAQPWDNPIAGLWCPLTSGRTIGTNNNCMYQRIYGGAINTSVRKVRMSVGTSSGNVGFAIYNTTGSGITAAPNARQATTGAIAAPASGRISVDLGSTVTGVGQGSHWFAWSSDTTVFTITGLTNTVTTTYQGGLIAAQTTAHPPPATAAPTATTATPGHFILDPP